MNTLRRSEDDFSSALDRRARLHRRARIGVLAAVVGYFFLPYEVQAVIPVWLLSVLWAYLSATHSQLSQPPSGSRAD